MNIARFLTEAPPSIRWRIGVAASRLVFSKAFAAFGAGSVIVKPLRLRGVERIRIGRDCAIYEGSWLEAEQGASIAIGDRVYMGHDVHVHAVGSVTIGPGCLLADGVLVSSGGHDMSDDKSLVPGAPISIGANCFLGQRAIVVAGVTIGDGSVIGAGAVVTRDVPAGATAAGVPARIVSTDASSPQ